VLAKGDEWQAIFVTSQINENQQNDASHFLFYPINPSSQTPNCDILILFTF
jgi:hypothetical protein